MWKYRNTHTHTHNYPRDNYQVPCAESPSGIFSKPNTYALSKPYTYLHGVCVCDHTLGYFRILGV